MVREIDERRLKLMNEEVYFEVWKLFRKGIRQLYEKRARESFVINGNRNALDSFQNIMSRCSWSPVQTKIQFSILSGQRYFDCLFDLNLISWQVWKNSVLIFNLLKVFKGDRDGRWCLISSNLCSHYMNGNWKQASERKSRSQKVRAPQKALNGNQSQQY